MEDKEINEKLAKAMGLDREGSRFCTALHFKGYKDPAIFAENVIWLLDTESEIYLNSNGYWITLYESEETIGDKDPYKAVALARITAEGKAND